MRDMGLMALTLWLDGMTLMTTGHICSASSFINRHCMAKVLHDVDNLFWPHFWDQ
jgi:hypothetical protein